MNIFHKVALQGLIKSRTRTFVTVIGVALSAALITSVATFAISLLNYMYHGAATKYGDWHVEYPAVDPEFVKEQTNNDGVLHTAYFENIGYAMLEGGTNPDKPYLFLAGFNEETFDTLPLDLISGRLPENDHEVVVSAHVASNGGVEFSIGDVLTLSVGERQSAVGTLNQHDAYLSDVETFSPSTEKTYTVVGICQRLSFEEQQAPGYTLVTKTDTAADHSESLTAFITLKHPLKVNTYVHETPGENTCVLNNNILRFLGIGDTLFNTLFFSTGCVLVALIMIGSIFLIYNAFHISLTERTHQFGILMSVGATEKQLRNSVLFEGLCIGAIGIPVGILVGIPAIKLVLSLTSKNFANLMYENVPLKLVVSLPAIAAAAAVSLITILISAYIPAKKAASIPVMECIRQTNEIKVDAKAIKTPGFVRRIYGLEGMLASQNFKRNKKRYRSVVLSLTLSVILFVCASTFSTTLEQASSQATVVTDYDISCATDHMNDEDMINLYNALKTTDGVTESRYQLLIQTDCSILASKLSKDCLAAVGDTLSGEMVSLPVMLQFIDDASYEKFVSDPALFSQSAPEIIAVAKMPDEDGTAETVHDMTDMFTSPEIDTVITTDDDGQTDNDTGKSIHITCADIIPPDTPPYTGTVEIQSCFFEIIVPWSLKEEIIPDESAVQILAKGLTFQSNTPAQSMQKMQALIEGAGITSGYTLYNVHAMLEENRNLLFIVKLFTSIFILMISLIAIANVFNTISTNIKLRRRELAMLRSVGMSDQNFNRMMRFECILYGLRTLAFGIPVSAVLSWLIFKGITFGETTIPFVFPWLSIGISLLGVFIIIFITMLYATNQVRKENIIDALRDDME